MIDMELGFWITIIGSVLKKYTNLTKETSDLEIGRPK